MSWLAGFKIFTLSFAFARLFSFIYCINNLYLFKLVAAVPAVSQQYTAITNNVCTEHFSVLKLIVEVFALKSKCLSNINLK